MAGKEPRLFYGYVVVTASFCIMTLAWGSNRTFGIFLEPMLQEFGWTRAAISGSFTINMLVMGVLALVAGRLTDSFGPRIVLIGCGVFLGVAYLLTSQVQTIWQFYLFYGVIGGIGMSGILTPLMSVVVRWFFKRRSLMSGILVAGPALGIMIMPLSSSFVTSVLGWRYSYLILGMVVLAGIVLAALFVRLEPASVGMVPYGAKQEVAEPQSFQLPGLSLREAVRTSQFWWVNLLSFCDLFLINVIVVHIVIHAIDMQIPATRAASVLSLAAGVSIPGRIFMGGIADRIGNRPAMMICLAMSVVAFLLLIFARGMEMLYLFAVLYGMGLWATGALLSPLIAELFGLKSHATLYSFTVFSSAIGSAAGPVLAGTLFDATGEYYWAFILCLVVSLIAILSVWRLYPIPKNEK